jgi:hypothetical protein
VTGDGWLDPGTVRLHYTLLNNDPGAGKYLRTIGGPWSFFRRVRCLIGGALIDDIDHYNRVHEMLHICSSNNNRENDDVEGFGYRWDSRASYGQFTDAATRVIPPNNSNLPKWNAMNACFKPLCGLLTQNKFIPLVYCPLTFEFEVVSGATDAIVSPGPAGGTFTVVNTSTNWQIEDVRIVGDIITLDNGLQNSYAEHILSGKSLPINYSTYISILQAVSFPSINVTVTRSVSRLKTVF